MSTISRREVLRAGVLAGAAASTTAFGPGRGQQRVDLDLAAAGAYPVRRELLPFGHGVLSGDPLADSVVLWTRVTIPDPRGWDSTEVRDPQGVEVVAVRWVVARDPDLAEVVARGVVRTRAARDWTVKVDVTGLSSATTYYYAFEALGYRSPVGRTRTAPAPGDDVGSLQVAHAACTSWWQDRFNGYARIGEREDLDLVTHAGDHVYDNSGGHPAVRFPDGPDGPQTDWDGDVDNGQWRSLAVCRRRYALYYSDPNLQQAHRVAPWAVMADQHDYEDAFTPDGSGITKQQAGRVFHEWTATRPVLPDGSGRFDRTLDADGNLRTPPGDRSRYVYRVLPFGDLLDVVLLDVRRFAPGIDEEYDTGRPEGGQGTGPDDNNVRSRVLGDEQWAWLQRELRASKARGATHRLVVNQVNLSQLRLFNLPFVDRLRGALDGTALQPAGDAYDAGEFYTTAWGGVPQERARLYRFLREEGLVDNVVVSGDSHGFFCSDLTETPAAPQYLPGGKGTNPVVGVEVVATSMGRPGGQDVIAEVIANDVLGDGRGTLFDDYATFDQRFRPLALGPLLALEQGAMAANPNLRYFNWRAEYGYALLQLDARRTVVECWTTPQAEPSDEQTLLVQLTSPVGDPGLVPVPLPTPVRGPSRGPLPPD